MASKNFCDLCDALIEDGDAVYSLAGDMMSKNEYGRYNTDIMTKPGTYAPVSFNYPMVDEKCYMRVRRLVEELKQGG